MFKKPESDDGREPPIMGASDPSPARPGSGGAATIGPTICIRGDLLGDEDLVVQGRIEGTVQLEKNLFTIGKDGRISATVNARVVHVEGTVEGDLHGSEQVILKRSANVQGNISSPRVTLEDGAHFKGSIDMDVPVKQGATVSDLKPSSNPADDPSKGKGALGKSSA